MTWAGIVAALLVRADIAALLLIAGSAKLTATSASRERWIAGYELIPDAAVPLVAFLLPTAELTAGSALLLGTYGPVGALAAAAARAPLRVGKQEVELGQHDVGARPVRKGSLGPGLP